MTRNTATTKDRAPVLIGGAVLDILTNQPIPDAHVYQGSTGTVTDADGVYVLDVVPGELVTISHVSYTGETFTAPEVETLGSVHYMEPAAYSIPEVEITADAPRKFPWGWLAAAAAAVGIYRATR